MEAPETAQSLIDQWINETLLSFQFAHLPAGLRGVSSDFHDLAHAVAGRARNAQALFALQHLLIAKDAAVRAVAAR